MDLRHTDLLFQRAEHQKSMPTSLDERGPSSMYTEDSTYKISHINTHKNIIGRIRQTKMCFTILYSFMKLEIK